MFYYTIGFLICFIMANLFPRLLPVKKYTNQWFSLLYALFILSLCILETYYIIRLLIDLILYLLKGVYIWNLL